MKLIDCSWQPVDTIKLAHLCFDIKRYGWKQSSVIKVAVTRDGEYTVLRGLHRVRALQTFASEECLPSRFQVRCIVLRPRSREGPFPGSHMAMVDDDIQSLAADYERWEAVGNRLLKDQVVHHLS